MGVSAPPTFETTKMKKMMWYAFSRPALSRMYGRMSSIEAPVVPMKLLITAPDEEEDRVGLAACPAKSVLMRMHAAGDEERAEQGDEREVLLGRVDEGVAAPIPKR